MKTFLILCKSFRNKNDFTFDWFDLSSSEKRLFIHARIEFHFKIQKDAVLEHEKNYG